MVLIALKLAQAKILNKACVYLFDDITVELDKNHVDRFFDVISTIPGQFFFTAIDPSIFQIKFNTNDSEFFQMNEGKCVSTKAE